MTLLYTGKSAERLANARKAKYQSATAQNEVKNTLNLYFSPSEFTANKTVLDAIQAKIDELVPLLGQFDFTTKLYRGQPEPLKALHKAISEYEYQNDIPLKAQLNPQDFSLWRKFQGVAILMFNLDFVLGGQGEQIIDAICQLCLDAALEAMAANVEG